MKSHGSNWAGDVPGINYEAYLSAPCYQWDRFIFGRGPAANPGVPLDSGPISDRHGPTAGGRRLLVISPKALRRSGSRHSVSWVAGCRAVA